MNLILRLARSRRVAVCALCCALVLTAGCSARRSEQLRGKGDVDFKNGKIAEARADYQSAAEANPDNPMAQVGLALCAAKEGNIDEALKYYETARGLSPSLPEGYKGPVMLLVEAKRYDEALAIAKAYGSVEAERGGLLEGVVLLQAKRTTDAVAAFEKLREAHPDSSEVKLNLGVAYTQVGKYPEAETLLRELVEAATPLSTEAHMALIGVLQAQGKMPEVLKEFKALADAQPEKASIQLDYARVLLVSGDIDGADTKAREILDKDPSSAWANYIAGAVKLKKGASEEAVAFLEKAAATLPEEKEIAALLEQAKTGKAPVANPTATATASVPGVSSGALTWRDLWKQAALKRLVSNRDTYLAEGGNEAREVIALAALFTQNRELAAEIASGLPAESGIGRFFTALNTKDPKQVVKFFEEWKPTELEAQILHDNALGYAMTVTGMRGEALKVFLFCLERTPDNVVALYNIAQVYRAVRQPVIAAQQMRRLLGKYPDNIDAYQMLYAALREGESFDQAREAAEASYTQFPEEQWSFLNLAQAYLDTRDPALALQVLTRAEGIFPGDPEVELAKASVQARLGNYAEARTTLEGISSTSPTILASRANLLALCALQVEDWAAVEAAADSADPVQAPDSLRVLKCLAAVKAENIEAAHAALLVPGTERPAAGKLGLTLTSALGFPVEGLTEEEQAWGATLGADHGLLINYGATYALQLARLYDASWTNYEKSLASAKPHIAIAQLAFAALYWGDKIEGANEKAEAVAEKLSNEPRAWIALSEMYKKQGDPDKEAKFMEKAVAVGANSPEAWSKYAAMQEARKDFKGAVESDRKLIGLQPDNPFANNNLAYMLLMAGGNDVEALKFAAIAQQKLPNHPNVLHTLGLAQLRTGDLQAAKTTLGRAADIDPANPTIAFDFGRALMKLGEKEPAKDRIRYALGISQRAGLEFPESAEAERLLTELN